MEKVSLEQMAEAQPGHVTNCSLCRRRMREELKKELRKQHMSALSVKSKTTSARYVRRETHHPCGPGFKCQRVILLLIKIPKCQPRRPGSLQSTTTHPPSILSSPVSSCHPDTRICHRKKSETTQPGPEMHSLDTRREAARRGAR